MSVRKEIISPQQFDNLERLLLRFANEGYDPDSATIMACRANSVRIVPPTMFESVELVVDPMKEYL